MTNEKLMFVGERPDRNGSEKLPLAAATAGIASTADRRSRCFTLSRQHAAVAAARYLVLTGWRSGEALGLRWADVDLVRRTATLAGTKTGRSVRPLSNAACFCGGWRPG